MSFVKELTPSDFRPLRAAELQANEPTLIMFYLPWCKWCIGFKEEWEAIAKIASFCRVATFNCHAHAPHLGCIREELPHLITSYPTIVSYQNGVPIEKLKGPRSKKAVLNMGMRAATLHSKI